MTPSGTTASPTARGGGPSPPATQSPALLAFVLTLTLVPRLLVLLRDRIWVEDEAYLSCASLISHGVAPYAGFNLQHFPFLEGLLAALFRLTGPSVRSVEVVTQVVVVIATTLVFAIGRRLAGTGTGSVAALIFAWSPLLLRYHVFEREVFVVAFLLAATHLVVTSDQADSWRRHAAAGAVLALAPLAKLTAVGAAGTLLAWVTVVAPARRRALPVGIGFALVAGGATAAASLAWGRTFLTQVVLFGLAHPTSAGRADKLAEYGRDGVDRLLLATLAALAALLVSGQLRRWSLVAALAVATFVLGPVLKPVVWSHNAVEILPWASLLVGWLVVETVQRVRNVARGGLDRAAERTATVALLALVATAVVVAALLPAETGREDRWLARAELAAMAVELAAVQPPAAPVVAPAIVSYAADRRDVVPYPEIDGAMREIADRVRGRGLDAVREIVADRRRRRMSPAVDDSLRASMPTVLAAISNGSAAGVLNCELAADWAGGIRLSEAFLAASGLHPVQRWSQCVLWVRAPLPTD